MLQRGFFQAFSNLGLWSKLDEIEKPELSQAPVSSKSSTAIILWPMRHVFIHQKSKKNMEIK
jgi:hypothetical protein